MHVNVHEETGVETRAERKDAVRQRERNAIDVRPRKLAQRRIHRRHHRERREEVLAELPVRRPGLALYIRSERQSIDEHRACADELDVVRTCVAQHLHPSERAPLDLEREQRCGLELAEAPLVGIADEGNLLGPQHDVRGRRSWHAQIDFLVRDHQPILYELVVKPRPDEAGIRVSRLCVDLSVGDAVPEENEPARITEGAGGSRDRLIA
jgi:hypothetical protein